MTDISTSKPTIVWLEDSVDEIADYLADVRIAPYTVHVAQGFRQLDGLLCSARIENWDVRAIIIDVMIKNVLNLTPYFPFIEAGLYRRRVLCRPCVS